MGEHLRNRLAREGLVFRPTAVSTLSKFLEPYGSALQEVSLPALEIIVEARLQREAPGHYARVRDFAGFRKMLALAVEEYATSGGTSQTLPAADSEFAAIYRAVTIEMERRGWCFGTARLEHAAKRVSQEPRLGQLLLTGFYSFTTPEIAFLRALAQSSELTVTLPESSPSSVRRECTASQVRNRSTHFTGENSRSRRIVVSSPTLDAEVNDIARRLHAERAAGRPYREMGVILRNEKPYSSALRGALEQFGIPARFHFGDLLAEQPSIRYLYAIIEAILSGWGHDATLVALRLPGSPIEQHGDALDFAMRMQTPNRGLSAIREIAGVLPASVHDFLSRLEKLTSWSESMALPETWARRFRTLIDLFYYRPIEDRVEHQHAQMWREASNALVHWSAAVDEAARVLDPALMISCRRFTDVLGVVLNASQLRTPDHRRDVVHVLDAFEARQWELPIVFVCGLIEKQFPKYHSENPILGDDSRRRLQQQGVELRTSAERQADEQFLFDLLLTRATERVVLTYPQLNAKYDANLPSFLLERARPFREEERADVRPVPKRLRAAEPQPWIYSDDLRALLAQRHRAIGATAVETYLRCPYLFFAQKTLRLHEPPDSPFDRLDVAIQGTIVHDVLERCFRERLPVEMVFNEVWDEICEREHIPRVIAAKPCAWNCCTTSRCLPPTSACDPAPVRCMSTSSNWSSTIAL